VEMTRDSEIESWAACHPDQFLFARVFYGKDYSLNALPGDASGDSLYTGESEVEVMAYVGWLADYLYRQEMPPNHRQLALCRILSRIPEHEAPGFLGSIAALHHHCLVKVNVKFAADQLLGNRSTFTEQDIDASKNEPIKSEMSMMPGHRPLKKRSCKEWWPTETKRGIPGNGFGNTSKRRPRERPFVTTLS
jgi:hypothetical protein